MYVIEPPVKIVLLDDPEETLEINGTVSRFMFLPLPSVIISFIDGFVKETDPVFSTFMVYTILSPLSITPLLLKSTKDEVFVTSNSAINVMVGSLIELPSLSIPLSLVSETIPDVLDAVAVRTLIILPESNADWVIVYDATSVMEPPGKIVFEVDPIVTFDTIIGLSYDNILFSASLNTSL